MSYRVSFKTIIAMLAWLLPATASAQKGCDYLFNEGVQLQSKLTLESQEKALDKFVNARICYDSQAKKKDCDKHIDRCRAVIDSLQKVPKVELSLSTDHLKFGAEGGFQKIQVFCNAVNWITSGAPAWVTLSRNKNNEIIVEAQENPVREERTGLIKVRCGNLEVPIILIQKKSNIFQKIINKTLKNK